MASDGESFSDKFKLRGLREKLKGQDHLSKISNYPVIDSCEADTHLYDAKVKAIHMRNTLGKLGNLVNRNHRHDEEHEQITDRKRTLIGKSHRFESFAPERPGNNIKWYVDGRDYFWAVSVAMERAKETIYIADWWLSPELFLRRPPYFNQEWRVDQVIKRAAERGINKSSQLSPTTKCKSAYV